MKTTPTGKNKGIVLLLAVAVIGVMAYVWYKKKTDNNNSDKGISKGKGTGGTVSNDKPSAPVQLQPPVFMGDPNVFPLKKGSKGDEVICLQGWLNRNLPVPYAEIAVDGIFGEETLTVFKKKFNATQLSYNTFSAFGMHKFLGRTY